MGRGCHDQVCGRQRSFRKQIRQSSFGCRDGPRYCVREARLRLKDKPLILRSPDKEPNTPLQGYFSRAKFDARKDGYANAWLGSYPGYPRARGLNSEGVAPLKPITPCHNLSLRFICILSSQAKSAGHSYAMRPLGSPCTRTLARCPNNSNARL